jgi:hypothetical protein
MNKKDMIKNLMEHLKINWNEKELKEYALKKKQEELENLAWWEVQDAFLKELPELLSVG